MKNYWYSILLLVLIISCINKKYKEYYKSGNIRIEAEKNEDGNYQGLYKEYYSNGRIFYEVNFIDGEKDGIEIVYDSLGNKLFLRNYYKGKFHGDYFSYYQNQVKKTYMKYDKGILHYFEEYDTLERVVAIEWAILLSPKPNSLSLNDSIEFKITGGGIRKEDQNITLLYHIVRSEFLNKEGPYEKKEINNGKSAKFLYVPDSIGKYTLHGYYIIKNDTGFGVSMRFDHSFKITP